MKKLLLVILGIVSPTLEISFSEAAAGHRQEAQSAKNIQHSGRQPSRHSDVQEHMNIVWARNQRRKAAHHKALEKKHAEEAAKAAAQIVSESQTKPAVITKEQSPSPSESQTEQGTTQGTDLSDLLAQARLDQQKEQERRRQWLASSQPSEEGSVQSSQEQSGTPYGSDLESLLILEKERPMQGKQRLID